MVKRMRTASMTLGIFLSMAAAAHAGSCGSVTSIGADLWKKWGEVAKKAGCAAAAVAGGAVTAEAGAPAMYAACYASASTHEKLVKEMIAYWNEQAKGGWATIGPRELVFGRRLEGTLVSTGGRVWMTHAPVKDNRVALRVNKAGGRARTEVTVCKIDEKGAATKLWEFEFDEGAKEGSRSRSLTGVHNHLLSVHLDAKSVTRKFEYTLRATKE